MLHCQFPECGQHATMTWALVDLCDMHRQAIAEEAEKYYNGYSTKSVYEQRPHYYEIAELIPWSRK